MNSIAPNHQQGADRAELRTFGLLAGALFAGLFGLLMPWLRHRPFPAWPWVLCIVLVVPALIAPQALRQVFAAWTAAGRILGWINSRLVLTIVFYAIITPVGVVMRLCGRDMMRRRFDPDCASYRVPSRQAPPSTMDRPF